MIDYVADYYYEIGSVPSGGADFDCARRKAVSLILPFILKEELSERQYICLKYKYELGKSQEEIAEILKLSQPTVSRHISSGKKAVNNKLKYCNAAVTAALNEYERLERSCV